MTEVMPSPNATQRAALASRDGGGRQHAEARGVCWSMVRRCNVIRRERPDLFEKVLAGAMSSSAALKQTVRSRGAAGARQGVDPGPAVTGAEPGERAVETAPTAPHDPVGGSLVPVPLLPDGTTPTALGRLADWEQAERVALMLGTLERSAPWWWADLLVQAERRWGETYAQLAALGGLDEGTLYNRRRVGVVFPPGRRLWLLPFGHYEAVTGLETVEQEEVLAWAAAPIDAGAERGRTRDEVRDEVRRRRGLPPPSHGNGSLPLVGGRGDKPAAGFLANGRDPGADEARAELEGAIGAALDGPVFPASAAADPSDVTARLAAWLAEGARLYDALADGAGWEVEALSPRDAFECMRMVELVLVDGPRGPVDEFDLPAWPAGGR